MQSEDCNLTKGKKKQVVEEDLHNQLEIMEGDNKKDETTTLPPGFRFHPSDEELITYYLVNKISDANFTGRAIADVDLNKCEPWDLPGKAKMGEKEWYFFSLRDRKYPTGVRTNRATSTGYWKTTGKDKEIFNSLTSELVGMKKTLVFYRGRAPRGEKSNWVMHEYRHNHSSSKSSSFRTTKQDEWVVCRVFQKSAGAKKFPSRGVNMNMNMNVNVSPPPYHLDIGIAAGPSGLPQMIQADHNFQFPIGRNSYMVGDANASHHHHQLAELTRMFRGGGGSPSSVHNTNHNLPLIPQSQLNNLYPPLAAGGGFTISGLNLNLGGGGGGGTSTQAVMRPIMPPPQPQAAMNHLQDVITTSVMTTSSSSYAAVDHTDYSAAEINQPSGSNRYMSIDQCMDLDTYWPPY